LEKLKQEVLERAKKAGVDVDSDLVSDAAVRVSK